MVFDRITKPQFDLLPSELIQSSLGNLLVRDLAKVERVSKGIRAHVQEIYRQRAEKHGYKGLDCFLAKKHLLGMLRGVSSLAENKSFSLLKESVVGGRIDTESTLTDTKLSMVGKSDTEQEASLKSALFLAASEGEQHNLRAILAFGADPNAVDDDGNAALHIASLGCQSNVVRILLEAGADPHITNTRGQAPLHQASRRGSEPLILHLLLGAGSDPNVVDDDGNTALHVASLGCKTDIVRTLLEAGADPNITNAYGVVPLHRINALQGSATLRILLEYGANLNIRDHLGQTPLSLAKSYGDIEMENILLKAGADPNLVSFPKR